MISPTVSNRPSKPVQSSKINATFSAPMSDDFVFPDAESRALFDDRKVPKILFSGLPRSGKSSIIDVVFRKASPHEVHYLSPSTAPQIYKVGNSNLMGFAALEIPGAVGELKGVSQNLLQQAKAVIFVIDIQTYQYTNEINFCRDLFSQAFAMNPNVYLAVFIHKADGEFYSVNDIRGDCQRTIHDRLLTALHEEKTATTVHFFSTSIYDQTVQEACSRVIQSLMPQSSALQQILDVLAFRSQMEKVFLIDVDSKLFYATDSSAFDPFNFELCSETINFVVETSSIYASLKSDNKENIGEAKRTNVCVVQLNTGPVLYMQEIAPHVVLTCMFGEEDFEHQFLVEFNIKKFQGILKELFDDS